MVKKEFVVGRPEVILVNDVATYRVAVSDGGGKRDWIEISVRSEFKEFLTTACDPVVIALIAPAMSVGANIRIEGPISPSLLRSVSNSVQSLIVCNKPELQKINIVHSGDYYDNTNVCSSIATGLSCGIDSLAVAYDYLFCANGSHEKITHFINNSFSRYRAIAERERVLVREAAASFSIPLIEVNSNLDILSDVPWSRNCFSTIEVHTFWNSAIASALQARINKFYYASTIEYAFLSFCSARDVAYIDPELLRLLSPVPGQFQSVGSEYSRVEKTANVRKLPQSKHYLNVCVAMPRSETHQNCGKCFKCMRTLLTLELTGGTTEYSTLFDLKAWGRVKGYYIASLYFDNDYFAKDLLRLVKKKEVAVNSKYVVMVIIRKSYNYCKFRLKAFLRKFAR